MAGSSISTDIDLAKKLAKDAGNIYSGVQHAKDDLAVLTKDVSDAIKKGGGINSQNGPKIAFDTFAVAVDVYDTIKATLDTLDKAGQLAKNSKDKDAVSLAKKSESTILQAIDIAVQVYHGVNSAIKDLPEAEAFLKKNFPQLAGDLQGVFDTINAFTKNHPQYFSALQKEASEVGSLSKQIAAFKSASTISTASVKAKTGNTIIPLHLDAGKTYVFDLTADASGTREALYIGPAGSSHTPAPGQYAAVTFGKIAEIINTPKVSGDYYLNVTSTYTDSNFHIDQYVFDTSNVVAQALRAPAQVGAVSDVSSRNMFSSEGTLVKSTDQNTAATIALQPKHGE